jgi:hypothetical protein
MAAQPVQPAPSPDHGPNSLSNHHHLKSVASPKERRDLRHQTSTVALLPSSHRRRQPTILNTALSVSTSPWLLKELEKKKKKRLRQDEDEIEIDEPRQKNKKQMKKRGR